MSLLQIGTINTVIRSPYLVPFSRLGNCSAQWLDESLACDELMEYWACEAYFMPRSDFRLIHHRMLAPERMGWKYKDAWMQKCEAETAQLIQHIHDKELVRSADFEHPRKGTSSWQEWRPYKRHLEGLFTVGKVMMIEQCSFQRVYDLTRCVMSDWDDERNLISQTEAETIMLSNSAHSLGIFHEQWLADHYRLKRLALAARREAKAEQQQIITVYVGKLGNLQLHADLLPLLERALAGKLTAAHNAVLSPFDPVVWNRKRAGRPFNFNCRPKHYIPVPRRQYGYSVSPLLHRGQLVGRMDIKMHRQTGILEVISLWLQEGTKPTTVLQKGLRQAITDFMSWQQMTRVTLGCCPQGLFTGCRTGREMDSIA